LEDSKGALAIDDQMDCSYARYLFTPKFWGYLENRKIGKKIREIKEKNKRKKIKNKRKIEIEK